MDNKQFDDIIKKKLESLNTTGSEDAWNLFKEKWDSSSLPHNESDQDEISQQDQELDAKIKQDLGGLRIPFNSQHWIILKEKLELEALFKKKLFVAKSIELLVLAFLVLGILNVWPIQNDIYHFPVYDIPMVPSIPVDKATAEKYETLEQSRLQEQQKLFASTKVMFEKSILSANNITSANRSDDLPPIPHSNTLPKSDNHNNSQLKAVEGVIPFIPFNTIPNILSPTHSEIVEPEQRSITQVIETKLDALEIPIRPLGYPDIVLNSTLDKAEENTYFSFAVGPKVNLINSPFDPVYGFDPYNTINTNFNISAKLNKEIGPIELYAGIGYTNTSYVPRLVDEIYESLESQFNVATLENIEFKTFNVPVGVKYNVIGSKNYQLYACAGVDLNIIANSEYIIQDVPIGRPSPSAIPIPTNAVNENTKLSQKEFNQGILSGGSLKDNLYATASVGLGLNWNFVNDYGIFIEPRYSHFISSKGIGPNEDKVHGLSIDLGVRYQLN